MPTSRSRLGSWGEDRASEYLSRKGYTLLETNYRCQWGEVDLVCQDGPCLVFVEVRTRRSQEYGTPEESLSKGKQERLIYTAQTYIAERQEQGSAPEQWRIDLISVVLDDNSALQRIDHLENAVQGE